MGEIIWNASQLHAINYTGKNLLLSAAAGSGKTATLTERIIRLLSDDTKACDISRMLIVTFTNDAAGELRERIGAALSRAVMENPQDKRLVRQLTALDTAAISTIHSFLLNELKPYFMRFSLPPDFSVADDASILEIKREIMLDTVNDYFDSVCQCENFIFLADCMSGARDDKSLDAALLSVWDDLMRLGLSPEFLGADMEGDDFLLSSAGAPVLDKIKTCSYHYEKAFRQLEADLSLCEDTQKYSAGAAASAESARALYSEAKKGYASLSAFLNDFSQPSLSPLKSERQTTEYVLYKNTRAAFVKELKSLQNDFFAISNEQLRDVTLKNKQVCCAVRDVLTEFDMRFTAAKRERGKVDFCDIERLAAKLFCAPDGSPTEEAVAAGEKYDYIFIDEYQDTNRLQDMVFSAICANTRRFMVGDVKQSIYGFRGACPEIFTNYRRIYEQKTSGEAVFMSENHRSDSEIINFSNMVSDYMFPGSSTPFLPEDKLICAKKSEALPQPVKICLVEESEDKALGEADFVAERIAEMLNSGEKLDSGESISKGDIAILLRSVKRADEYKSALEKRGIAVKNNAATDFFSHSEVLLIFSILSVIDNPTSDIQLAAAMKSPVFGFTLDELVVLRSGDTAPLWYSVNSYAKNNSGELADKLADFIDTINNYRELSRGMSCEKLLYMLISELHILQLEDESGTGRLRRSVRTMYSHAIACASGGGGLHELILYLRSLMEKSDIKEPESDADAVSILTVHRSKGLEYPVVFLCDNAREFNLRSLSNNYLLDAHEGMFLKLTDPSGLVKCDNPLRRAAREGAKRQALDEEMRILYVALTRARERLIITLSCKNADDALEASRSRLCFGKTPYAVSSVKSPGMWLLDAASADISNSCFTLEKVMPSPVAVTVQNNEADTSAEFDITLDDVKEKLSFNYPLSFLAGIPAKLPVSKLSPTVLDEGETVGQRKKEMTYPSFLSDKKELSAAEMGTATHKFLQFCSFSRLIENGAESEAERMVDMGFISSETRELIRLDEIKLFCKSALIKQIINAREIQRELRFNIMLPANEFTQNSRLASSLSENDTQICVQGVIDCLIRDENGKYILIDYKTDRLTKIELEDTDKAKKTLCERHAPQLCTYKRICEKILGEKIDRVLIYSLMLGEAFSVLTE